MSAISALLGINSKESEKPRYILFGPDLKKYVEMITQYYYRADDPKSMLYSILPSDLATLIFTFFPHMQRWNATSEDKAECITVVDEENTVETAFETPVLPMQLITSTLDKQCNHRLTTEYGYNIDEPGRYHWQFEILENEVAGGIHYVGICDTRYCPVTTTGFGRSGSNSNEGFWGFYSDLSNSSQPTYLDTSMGVFEKPQNANNSGLATVGSIIDFELIITNVPKQGREITFQCTHKGEPRFVVKKITPKPERSSGEIIELHPCVLWGRIKKHVWRSRFLL